MTKKKQVKTWYIYKRLFPYIKQYWLFFIIAIVANLFYGGLSASFTYLVKPILDKGFINRDPVFIHWLPAIIVILFLLRGLSNLISSYSMAYTSRGVIRQMRQTMFGHFQGLPANYYDQNHSGTMLATMVYNIDQISNASATAIATFVQSVGIIVGLLVIMFSISWQLSCIYFVALPIIAYIVHLTSMRTRGLSKRLQHSMGKLVNTAEDNIDGYRVVRMFDGVEHENERFNKLSKKNFRLEMKNVLNKSLSVILVQLVASIVLAITVYLATSAHMGKMLTAGDFMAIIAAMLAILKPMKDLTNVNNTIQRGVAGAESVFSTLDLEEEKDEGAHALDRAEGRVEFDDVSFAYTSNEDRPVLKDIAFSVKSGECVALVGHSGSGKSTLMSLLPLFYDHYSGSIKLDGLDLREYHLKALRKQFSLVSQDVVLFDDTVANNISYGDFENVDQDRVKNAAKLAYADDFISEMPEGYKTMIGQDGVLLSGGQRQRIAIARAIYKNAPILIFDEATSALDTESERYIQKGLESLKHDRTTFIIAHRLSTIEHADKIVVMSEGEVVEVGVHSDLLAKDGYYAKLYKMQFKDEGS